MPVEKSEEMAMAGRKAMVTTAVVGMAKGVLLRD